MVCNLDKHTQPGSHWIGLYRHATNIVDVFDSYGGIPKQVEPLVKGCQVNYISKQLQGHLTTTCGQHVLFFGYHRTLGLPFGDILDSYTTNLEANDMMVCEFVQDTFGVETELRDEDLIYRQVSRAFR